MKMRGYSAPKDSRTRTLPTTPWSYPKRKPEIEAIRQMPTLQRESGQYTRPQAIECDSRDPSQQHPSPNSHPLVFEKADDSGLAVLAFRPRLLCGADMVQVVRRRLGRLKRCSRRHRSRFKSVGDGESVKEKRERGQRGPSMTLGKLRALRGGAEYQRNRERRADPARSSGAAADAADQARWHGGHISICTHVSIPPKISLRAALRMEADQRNRAMSAPIRWMERRRALASVKFDVSDR